MDVLLELLSSQKDALCDPWHFAHSSYPPLSQDDYGYPMSINVIGFFKDESQRVVYAYQHDDLTIGWRTACSEGWEISSTITHWAYLYASPVVRIV